MLMRKGDFLVFVCGGTGLGLVLGGALIVLINRTPPPEPKPDPERALFMLQCVYEWNLSNETCEAVLHGDPLPPFDKEVDC